MNLLKTDREAGKAKWWKYLYADLSHTGKRFHKKLFRWWEDSNQGLSIPRIFTAFQNSKLNSMCLSTSLLFSHFSSFLLWWSQSCKYSELYLFLLCMFLNIFVTSWFSFLIFFLCTLVYDSVILLRTSWLCKKERQFKKQLCQLFLQVPATSFHPFVCTYESTAFNHRSTQHFFPESHVGQYCQHSYR